jgi:8-oxo-dGTP pyrophosphatase MutT (NUDIX family)
MSGSEQSFSLAAYAVVTNERDEVLLTRRREGGEWVLPGGSVKQEEAPWEAAEREVREETGVEISDLRLTGVYTKRTERDLVLVFSAAAVRGTPRGSDERDRVAFTDANQLPERTAERDRQRIAHALAAHQQPVLAVQPSDADEPPPGTR